MPNVMTRLPRREEHRKELFGHVLNGIYVMVAAPIPYARQRASTTETSLNGSTGLMR